MVYTGPREHVTRPIGFLRPKKHQQPRKTCLEVKGDLAGQVPLAVPRHHLLPDVVELDVLDATLVLVIFDRFVHSLVCLHPLLEILANDLCQITDTGKGSNM